MAVTAYYAVRDGFQLLSSLLVKTNNVNELQLMSSDLLWNQLEFN